MSSASFILPPDEQNFKPFRNQPLVALHLLTILRNRLDKNYDFSIIDLRGIKKENVKFYVPERDIYFYSVYTIEWPSVVYARDIIRQTYPNAIHIAGGPHINILKEKAADGFDAIVIGEGEETIIQVVKDVRDKRLKPIYHGIAVSNLDAYSFAARDFLPKSAIVDREVLDAPNRELLGTTVLFSRGCPFRCTFCANMQYGPVKFRSPTLIEQEIEYLKAHYGVQALALKDDNGIPVNRHVAAPFLEAIGRTGVKWRGQSRANGISEEVVKLAAASGCTDIALGIESVSEMALKASNKKLNLTEAKNYIGLLNRYGIASRLHFIIGLPGEEDDIAQQIIRFVDESEPRSVLLSLLCPIPGSRMFENPEEFGIRIKGDSDWERYRTAFARFDENETPQLTFEYDSMTPWGPGRTADRIVGDYLSLQATFRERGLNF